MEEIAAVDNLQTIFGEKVLKYMIVVFTGGDELEDEGMTLDEYLTPDGESSAPNELQVLTIFHLYNPVLSLEFIVLTVLLPAWVFMFFRSWCLLWLFRH